MSSIPRALLVFVAVVALADWLGTGHQIAGLLTLCGVLLMASWLPDRGWCWLLAALLWFSVAVAAVAVVQMFGADRARGPFRSPNFLGWFSVLCFFLSLMGVDSRRSEARKPGYTAPGLCAAANLLSLALSQSRASMLALAAGLPFLGLLRLQPRLVKATVPAASAACILAATLIRSTSEQGRAGIWRVGLQIWLHRPLLGYGEGGVSVMGMVGFFSVPLDLMLSTGILGLLAGCWLYWRAWRVAPPALRGFLAAWVVNGLFLYGTPAVFLPLFLVLGRLARREECEERDRHEAAHAEKNRNADDQAETVRLGAPAQ